MDSHKRHIVITGASSGIGAALALHYAEPGVRLSLSGRDPARLDAVCAACTAKGAAAHPMVIDVTDAPGMHAWLEAIDAQAPVDLVIANAGISGGTDGMFAGESDEQVRRIFAVNLQGVLNTVQPLQPRMAARGRGQIALMSSLAGYRGWPGAPAYCASKAAVKVYGEALRGALAPAGVRVSVICPGFVRSRMTAVNRFAMPLIMDASCAAAIIAKGLNRNTGRIAFPRMVVFFVWLFSILPDTLMERIMMRLPAKSGLSAQNDKK